MEKSSDSFSLKGSDEGFDTKKQDIFQQLESLETKYNNNLINRFSTDDVKEDRSDVGSKESAPEKFRIPRVTPPTTGTDHVGRGKLELSTRTGRRDYHERPHRESRMDFKNKPKHSSWKRKSRHDYSDPAKWTKYSLEDTDIGSESQNKSIALQFLTEQRTRNKESEPESVVNLDDKITFSKPSSTETEESAAKPKMYGSVLRMPECVVGSQKTKHVLRKQPEDASAISAGGSVQLEFDFEDEAEDDEKSKQKEKITFKKSKQKRSIRKRDDDADA